MITFFLGLNIAKVSANALACLRRQNAFSQSVPYLNLTSFLVRFVSGIATFEQSQINLRLQFASPRNAYTSLRFQGVGYSISKMIFSGSIRIPLTLTINPRKLTSFLKNLHFSRAVRHPALLSRSKTASTSLTCCSRLPIVNTRRSSTYAITVISSSCRSASLITS